MRRLPDWLIYFLVLSVVLIVLYSSRDRSAIAPPAPPDAADGVGPLLPAASAFDPEVLVDVGPVSSGVGTAFAIRDDGWWLTARHVVDSCDKVGIVVGRGAAVPATEIKVARFADIALIRTGKGPAPLQMDLDESDLRLGETAFHMGYPQGHPGEAASRLIGRERLIARGRYNMDEPVLAWAEVGRTDGLFGTLAGMSGGPVLDTHGRVIGITVAESSRRGRIYTASPASILTLLKMENVQPTGDPVGRLTLTNYGPQADKLRRNLAVSQVVCVAEGK
jgi:S1-C subfamily serine protease